VSTSEPPIRPWLPDALARLTHLTELGANWDSYGGDPVTADALAQTRALINMLSAWHAVAPNLPPQVVPVPDGGVQIEWHENGYDLDVEIHPDGHSEGWLRRITDEATHTWGRDYEAEQQGGQ